ncbi:hypothetical protein V8E51_013080 [Hyaloscypha variabilis]|jgi:hypothetical protein|uniref:BZIP domain-containing protein n=1 Tax=Hyaloscypha variabilis (strain UAMH 11265 / GT02V1 / F) TaxID=1149755 RepID=A0A2J6RGT5_HYAVF|nr:hypothetical protein L207DRAFT_568647 [Hyaloscypha variabilis F]
MAEGTYQGFFGDSMSFNPQYQQTEQSCYQVDYDLLPLAYQNQPNAQYDPITSQLTRNYCDISNTAWSASNSVYSPSSQDFNPTNGVDLDKNLQTLELNQVSSSKDTEKRRMQNRNSQNAHRQRNKKLIEDLHQEVAEFSKYSLEMYHTLQELKETTKALVMTIDQALSMHPPPIRQDYSNLRRPST